jgi:hypothetical protein
MFVKPAEGRKVRHPITKQHLDAEGAEVPESTYWLRRLAEGDVVPAAPAAPALESPPEIAPQ